MAWTFGAGATDNILINPLGGNAGGNSSQYLCAGWFFPTTLTATRRYWNIGAVTNVQVGGTTSELSMVGDRVTTTSTWNTTGAGIVTNAWQFIAAWNAVQSAGNASWTVWVGTQDTPPVSITTSAGTAGVGNGTSGTTFRIGGDGSTLPFQGDIGSAWCLTQSAYGTGTFPTLAVGIPVTDEVNWVYQNVVLPIYLGQGPTCALAGSNGGNGTIINVDMTTKLTVLGRQIVASTSANVTPIVATITGATFTEAGCPNVHHGLYPLVPALRRR